MKRYIISSQNASKEFCKQSEATLIDGLQQAGVTTNTLDEMFIDVRPAGSGYRINVQFPSRVFHGRKISRFGYQRDVSTIIKAILESDDVADLVDRQSELLKPARKSSSTSEAVKRARNSTDPNELTVLAQHNASTVRAKVATNPHTPSHVVYKLACDRDLADKVDSYKVIANMDSEDWYNYIFDPEAMFPRTAIRLAASPYWGMPVQLRRQLIYYLIDNPDKDTLNWFGGSMLPEFAKNLDLEADDYLALFNLEEPTIDYCLASNRNVPTYIHKELISRYADRPDISQSDDIVQYASKHLN